MSGGGIAVGGGGIGLIIAIVIVAVNAFGGDASVLEDLSGVTVGSGQTSSEPLDCQTGADAQDREDCRIVAYVNSIQDYWDGQMPELPRGADGVLHGADLERVWTGIHRRRPLLLSRRTARSTSISGSSRSSRIVSVRGEARWRRRT